MLSTRPLGDTGLMVPPVALGTVKIGRNTGVKYPAPFDLPEDAQVLSLLSMARELGVSLIDTAPAYGLSEQRLGQLLPGSRDEWLLCTKAGEEFNNQQSTYDFSSTGIIRSVERSLQRLKTDYLDLVLIHSDGRDRYILEETDAMAALDRMKSEGKIRLAGMSTKTVEGGIAAIAACDVLMVTLNRSDDSQLPVIEAAREAGRGILLKKIFASGHDSPAESLAYALSVPGTHSAVIGTLNPEHLQSNVKQAADIVEALSSRSFS